MSKKLCMYEDIGKYHDGYVVGRALGSIIQPNILLRTVGSMNKEEHQEYVWSRSNK